MISQAVGRTAALPDMASTPLTLEGAWAVLNPPEVGWPHDGRAQREGIETSALAAWLFDRQNRRRHPLPAPVSHE